MAKSSLIQSSQVDEPGAPRQNPIGAILQAARLSRSQMWLALAWLLAACFLLPFVSRLQSRLEVEAQVAGAEYGQVAKTLKTDFRSVFADSLVLVVSGLTPHTLSLGQILDRVVAEVESEPSVEGTLSYRNTQDPLFLGSGGTGALVIVGLKRDASTPSKEAMLARFVREPTI